MGCTCPDIRCPIHGEPLPESIVVFDESDLDVPEFIRRQREGE